MHIQKLPRPIRTARVDANPMKPDVLLEKLEARAAALAVKVSYEQLGHVAPIAQHGGLCRVKGQYRIIIDKRATTEERATTLQACLEEVERRAQKESTTTPQESPLGQVAPGV
jgi:hypothetical protein